MRISANFLSFTAHLAGGIKSIFAGALILFVHSANCSSLPLTYNFSGVVHYVGDQYGKGNWTSPYLGTPISGTLVFQPDFGFEYVPCPVCNPTSRTFDSIDPMNQMVKSVISWNGVETTINVPTPSPISDSYAGFSERDVRLYTYATVGTFDNTAWRTIESIGMHLEFVSFGDQATLPGVDIYKAPILGPSIGATGTFYHFIWETDSLSNPDDVTGQFLRFSISDVRAITQVSQVPEPTSLGLYAVGLFAIAVTRRRKPKSA